MITDAELRHCIMRAEVTLPTCVKVYLSLAATGQELRLCGPPEQTDLSCELLCSNSCQWFNLCSLAKASSAHD